MRMFLIFILIFIAGVWLRFDRLGDRSFWFDEIVELGHVKGLEKGEGLISDGEGSGRVITRGYYVVLSFFKNLGINEFVARLPAAIFGILAIPLVYFLGKSLFDEKTGILSSFLLSVSTFHIAYSQEARPYSMLCFFSVLTLYFLYNALKRGRIIWWVSFLVATLINIYTHYAAFYILGAEVVFGILWVLINFKSYKKILGKYGLILLCLFVLSFFALKPVIVNGIKSVLKPGLLNRHIDDLSFNLGFFYRVFGDFTCLSMPFGYRKFIFVIYILFFLFGIISSARKYLMETLGIILFITVPFLMVFTFFKPLYFFNPRYFIFLLPIILIGTARGLVTVSGDISKLFKFNTNIVLSMLVFLLGIMHINPLVIHHYSEKDNWREAGDFLNMHAKKGDIILIDTGENVPALSYYVSEDIKKQVPITSGFEPVAKDTKTIWCVVYADDSFIGTKGYAKFRKKLCVFDVKRFGNIITVYEFKPLDKVKPGDIIKPIRFEAKDSPSFIGRNVMDEKARSKYARYAAVWKDGKNANLLVYGPWLYLPKGNYIAKFRMKIKDNKINEPVVRIDVNNANARSSLILEKNICGVEFNKSIEYQDFCLQFSHDGNGKLEFRVHFLGETDLWVDFAEVMDKGVFIKEK